MNDTLIEQTIPLVFPAEKASPELHTRVQALQPSTKTAPRLVSLRFRWVVAVVAMLWIGHNIPAALRVWNHKGYTYASQHTTHWAHDATKDYLQSEFWSARGKSREVTYGDWNWDAKAQRRYWKKYDKPRLSIVSEGKSYYFREGDPNVTVRVLPKSQVTPPSVPLRLLGTLTTLVLHTVDRREEKTTHTVRENTPGGFTQTTTYDPATKRYTWDRKNAKGEGTRTVMEPMKDIPDSYFALTFPKGARFTTVPAPVTPPAPNVVEQAANYWNKVLVGN